MKKRKLISILTLLLAVVFAFSLTACSNEVGTLESLQNEYGIVVDGGSFEEGSTLVLGTGTETFTLPFGCTSLPSFVT